VRSKWTFSYWSRAVVRSQTMDHVSVQLKLPFAGKGQLFVIYIYLFILNFKASGAYSVCCSLKGS
jgi:hypothetical protein